MNRLELTTIFLLSVLLFPAGLPGQDEPQPNLSLPNESFEWTVLFQPESKSKSESQGERSEERKSLEKIVITRHDSLQRDMLHYTDGSKIERWWSSNSRYVFTDLGGKIRGLKSAYLQAARFDESIFWWVDDESYVDLRRLPRAPLPGMSGKNFWYFEREIVYSEEEEGRTVIHRVWVNPETFFPVAWTDGSRSAFFAFRILGPEFKLVVPNKFKEAYSRYGN